MDLDQKTEAASGSLDTLHWASPDSINGFALGDLEWEHFKLDPETLALDENRGMDLLLGQIGERIGGFVGKSVLELGPYEGYDSKKLEGMGVGSSIAIEGNPLNFIKCLIVKNHFALDRTRFLLGDFTKYLAESNEKFDFIFASGVLYHLVEPFEALENIISKTGAIGICTTYFHPDIQLFKSFTGKTREVSFPGMAPFILHERGNTQLVRGKKHGLQSTAWMFELDDLMRYLDHRGFDTHVLMKRESLEEGQLRARLLATRR
jgi:hypothetical protein